MTRTLPLAAALLVLAGCAHQPYTTPVTQLTAVFEVTTADGTRTSWTSVNTKPETASHTTETPTGTVRVFARPGAPWSHLAVSLTRVQTQTYSTAAGDYLQLPESSIETQLQCRLAKGESCVVRNAADKPLVSVRWKG